MNLHKMIEIYLKDDNMHIFVMINALICINNYVITCINSMLSNSPLSFVVLCYLILSFSALYSLSFCLTVISSFYAVSFAYR